MIVTKTATRNAGIWDLKIMVSAGVKPGVLPGSGEIPREDRIDPAPSLI